MRRTRLCPTEICAPSKRPCLGGRFGPKRDQPQPKSARAPVTYGDDGEREAARLAAERIRARLAELRGSYFTYKFSSL